MIKAEDKYEIIYQMTKVYPIKLLCKVAQVSRSGYYKYISRKASLNKDCEIEEKILHVYTKSHTYKKILQLNNITQSMSRKGNCYDNASMENFFSHLKCELIYQNYFHTKEELINAIDEYIQWYNNERIQQKLKSCTPIEFRCTV